MNTLIGSKLLIFFGLALLLLGSCAPTRHLKDGELMYTGTEINIKNPKQVVHASKLKTNLLTLSTPKPLTAFGKFKLWIYNITYKEGKEKRLRKWLNTKLGRPPVLFQQKDILRSELAMEKYLQDQGYFGSEVEVDTIIDGKTIRAVYYMTSDGRYKFRNIHYPPDTSTLTHIMTSEPKKKKLKSGKYYDRIKLDEERNRLTNLATSNGYFGFDRDRIYYYVDTTVGQLQADIYLEVFAETDSFEYQQYRMGDVYVYPNYSIRGRNRPEAYDTIRVEEIRILQHEGEIIKPKIVRQSISQEKGDLYNKQLQELTLDHFLELGIFKFANLKFAERFDSSGQRYLDRYIYLTPSLNQDLTAEFQINNRTGNFLGSAVTGSYTHRNLFNGAERFELSATAGVENQLGSGTQGGFVNTIDLKLSASLQVPQFLMPFKIVRPSKFFVPHTRMSIGGEYRRRTEFYTIQGINAQFGYNWQASRSIQHQINPINISVLQVSDITPAFESLLQSSPRLLTGFQDVFIAGLQYIFTYTSQRLNPLENYHFFRGELETSGNLANALGKISKTESGEQFTIAGLPVSQYARLLLDYRYYIPLGNRKLLIFRGAPAVGLPYGNSEILPYTKQFFAGGANSIRAFRLRGLGPGSYLPPNSSGTRLEFVDQTGDFKIETNVEYRFPMVSYLYGALFVDAGNIWLLNTKDPSEYLGGTFTLNNFMGELAVGTGFGFRLDFDYFAIRLDIAFPLRDPTLPKADRWVVGEIDPLSKSWRQDQLVWNLAIGYPF